MCGMCLKILPGLKGNGIEIFMTNRQNALDSQKHCTKQESLVFLISLDQIISSYVVQSNTNIHRCVAFLFVKPLPCLQAKDTVLLRHIDGGVFSFPWRYTGVVWLANIKNKYIHNKYKHPSINILIITILLLLVSFSTDMVPTQ